MFVRLNACLFLVTGLLKLCSIIFIAKFKLGIDPIFGVNNLWTVGCMTIIEIAVGVSALKGTA